VQGKQPLQRDEYDREQHQPNGETNHVDDEGIEHDFPISYRCGENHPALAILINLPHISR
jgi:hypothetical protein